MKLSPLLISVSEIVNPFKNSSQFSEEKIEKIARAILKAEGLINPIIVYRLSLESYQLVQGELEYYAAVKAREIDPFIGEMIDAFILEGEKEEALKEQIELLRESRFAPPVVSPYTVYPSETTTPILGSSDENDVEEIPKISQPIVAIDHSAFESRLTQLESRFEKHLAEIEKQNRAQNIESFQDIEQRLKKLESKETISPSLSLSPIEALNTLTFEELVSRLKDIPKSKIKTIIDLREKGEFDSLLHLRKQLKDFKIPGVGDATLLKICDRLLSN